jgi:hypothetical protein
MATIKQIEANRRNSLKSTGPTTPEGKAAVRLNALRHGLRARTVVLPGEQPEEFQQLCDDLEAEWRPKSRTEQFYVEQMAVSQWELNRMEMAELSTFDQVNDAKRQVPLLDRLWQCQCRAERAYARAQRERQRLQYSRSQSPQWQEAREHAPQPSATQPVRAVPFVMSPVAAAPLAGGPPSPRPESLGDPQALARTDLPNTVTQATNRHVPAPVLERRSV